MTSSFVPVGWSPAPLRPHPASFSPRRSRSNSRCRTTPTLSLHSTPRQHAREAATDGAVQPPATRRVRSALKRPAAVLIARGPRVRENAELRAVQEQPPARTESKVNWESMGFIPYIAVFSVFVLARKIIAGQVDKVVNRDVKRGSVDGVEKGRPGVIVTEEEEKELHVYKCGGCGYEIWPARGREFKFFPDSFKCPVCGTPKSEFWDLNDENDPRNWEEEEDDDDDEDQQSEESSEDESSPDAGEQGQESQGDVKTEVVAEQNNDADANETASEEPSETEPDTEETKEAPPSEPTPQDSGSSEQQ